MLLYVGPVILPSPRVPPFHPVLVPARQIVAALQWKHSENIDEHIQHYVYIKNDENIKGDKTIKRLKKGNIVKNLTLWNKKHFQLITLL